MSLVTEVQPNQFWPPPTAARRRYLLGYGLFVGALLSALLLGVVLVVGRDQLAELSMEQRALAVGGLALVGGLLGVCVPLGSYLGRPRTLARALEQVQAKLADGEQVQALCPAQADDGLLVWPDEDYLVVTGTRLLTLQMRPRGPVVEPLGARSDVLRVVLHDRGREDAMRRWVSDLLGEARGVTFVLVDGSTRPFRLQVLVWEPFVAWLTEAGFPMGAESSPDGQPQEPRDEGTAQPS
jgi:hypothetical protein